MNRILTLTAAALLTALALAAPSLAAAPIPIGTNGGTPDIAVDDVGRAHIVWDDGSPVDPAPDVVQYCQIARGAGSCGNPETLSSNPISIQGRPHVFTYNPNSVSVVYKRCCAAGAGTRELYSVNDGINFFAEDILGTDVNLSGDEAVLGLNPLFSYTLLAENITGGARVQNTDITSPPTPISSAALGSFGSAEGAIGLDSTGRPVAVYQLQTNPWRLTWRKFRNDVTPVDETNINDQANWTPEATISSDRIDVSTGPALASGTGGPYLFWQKRSPDQGFVSRFNGTGWDPPVQIVADQSFNDLDLVQDTGGRLHAVWNAYGAGALRYRTSDDGGLTWSPTVDIARGEIYAKVRVSAAPDHGGFAVWDSAGPGISAVPLEALPPLPGGGGGGGGGSDMTAPGIGGFRIGNPNLGPGQGTNFEFNASEAGQAVITLRRAVAGLRVRRLGRRVCVPRTRRLERRLRRAAPSPSAFRRTLGRRRCTARKQVGQLRQAAVAGQNTMVFNGTFAGRRLRRGRYFASLVVTDAAGNVSRTATLRFRVLRPRRPRR